MKNSTLEIQGKEFKVGSQFGMSSTPSTLFKVVKLDIQRDHINYKVIGGGRIGQVNKEILSDLISMNTIDIIKE